MSNFSNKLMLASLLAFARFICAAPSDDTANVLMQAAMKKELVDGDLNGAIKQYAEIVAKYKNDRAVTAMALVHMAECYQKMGDAESRKIYEQVVREYGDQKEAVTLARARLGGTVAQNTGIATRQVWTGPKVDVYGAVAPDGRHLAFVDQETGDLALHDLSTGEDHHITNKGSWSDSKEYAEKSVFAPDGKQVAYSWFNKDGRYDLRVIGVSASSDAPQRVLYSNPDIDWIAPYDWSRDGKWIAVQLQRKDRTAQMGLVAASDGSLRILKSVDWRLSIKVSFSPDSRYLAFDLPAGESSEQRDVYVLAIDGSSQIPAVIHPAEDLVIGWSPNGRHLLFASDRTGKTAIYALAFESGKMQGTPMLVQSDIGQASVIGLSRPGTLFYGVKNGSRDFLTAAVDFETGRVLTPPSPAVQKFLGTNYQPDWSRDGRLLSYQSYREHQVILLVIRSVETGETRELRPKLTYLNFARWSPDGRSFIAQGVDFKGREGLYRIDAQTGDAEGIVMSPPGQVSLFAVPSSDGKEIYYLRGPEGRQSPKVLVDRDIASGSERELLGGKCTDGLSIAWDGQSIACGTLDPAAKELGLLVIPVSGGAPRELLRLKQENDVSLPFTQWTPDGRFIVFRKGGEVWAMPVSGGQPRKIDLGAAPVLDLRIHPDGRRIAFMTRNKTTSEVWAMENLTTALNANK